MKTIKRCSVLCPEHGVPCPVVAWPEDMEIDPRRVMGIPEVPFERHRHLCIRYVDGERITHTWS